MQINPAPQVRQALYVVAVFLNAVVGALQASDVVIPVLAAALLAGYNAVVAIMATANVSSK